MGKQNQTKTKRNMQLLKDYLSGEFTTSGLIAKYDISNARLYQLVNRELRNIGKRKQD